MKAHKKVTNRLKRMALMASGLALSANALATDKLANALTGDVQDILGGSGTFWKIFILVDIILAAAMAVKAKNPMVFAGVFVIAFIPALLINAFVF
jgi:hypothetical protein